MDDKQIIKPKYRLGDEVVTRRHGGEIKAKIVEFLDKEYAVCEVLVKERFVANLKVR